MNAFHAYDIRGIYPEQFNKDDCYKIGFFLPELLKTKQILVGRDMRTSSPEIFESLCRGITDADGVWVTANDDFVCYTCGEDWMHIKIAGFREIDEDFFEMNEYDEEGTRYYSADPNDPVIVEG